MYTLLAATGLVIMVAACNHVAVCGRERKHLDALWWMLTAFFGAAMFLSNFTNLLKGD